MKIKIVVISFLFIFYGENIFSQGKFHLQILPIDSTTSLIIGSIENKILLKKEFNTKKDQSGEVQQCLHRLYSLGYFAASFDSTGGDSLNLKVYLHAGESYRWIKLSSGNADHVTLRQSGYSEKLFQGSVFSMEQTGRLFEKILESCENNGYPFASLRLNNLIFDHENVSAQIYLQKNRFVKIDSIVVRGTANLSSRYLQSYLGIKPGDPYNESLIRKVPARVRELPFVTEKEGFKVLFLQENTKLILNLDKKQASQFDAIVGVIPNENFGVQGAPNEGQRVFLTGEAHLRLHNAYGKGELLDINWKQPEAHTADLKTALLYPFVLRTPFGADLQFSLYKKDTTYIDADLITGIQYILTGGNYLKAFVQNKTSSLISTSGLQYLTALPTYADYKIQRYGLGIRTEKVDYRLNPRKGYTLTATGTVGTKHILKNQKIDEKLYDSIQLKSTQYNGEYSGDLYLQTGKRTVLDLGMKGAFLIAPDIFSNELFRIGGLKSLRGFDEESILASDYTIFKLEYRYLMETNSYLFLFINGASWHRKSRTNPASDTPIGFGTGITFQTKLGIFSVSYALGREFSNPIYFKNAKIHFGLINYF